MYHLVPLHNYALVCVVLSHRIHWSLWQIHDRMGHSSRGMKTFENTILIHAWSCVVVDLHCSFLPLILSMCLVMSLLPACRLALSGSVRCFLCQWIFCTHASCPQTNPKGAALFYACPLPVAKPINGRSVRGSGPRLLLGCKRQLNAADGQSEVSLTMADCSSLYSHVVLFVMPRKNYYYYCISNLNSDNWSLCFSAGLA